MPVADYHERFAAVYDTLYADRNVAADARYASGLLGLEKVNAEPRHVLDFGCGCGAHVLAFAEMGLDAAGFDTSPAMLERARARAAPKGSGAVRFFTGDFAEFCDSLNGTYFDGVVSIFQVFNCMESPQRMLRDLRLIRGRLSEHGRFLIDLWNGAAVFDEDPRPDVRHFSRPDDPNVEIIRITVPQLDRVSQRCTLQYRFMTVDRAKGGTWSEFESIHQLTFLTPLQYRHLFELAGFRILDEFRRGSPGTPITAHDWYISYLLQADSQIQ